MNIKNTVCRLSELTQEQVNTLNKAISESDYCQWEIDDCLIGFYCDGNTGTWEGPGNPAIVTYTEMMQLLGKTMKEFTKSDLKTGMFVKQRDGDYAVVLDKTLSTMRMYTELRNIASSLYHNSIKSSDIMAVYTTASRDTLECHLGGESLTLIWERTEQTPAQKEMEVLLTNMVTLEYETKSKMEEIQKQIKVVQAKL
jgi:hypothetical protein